MKPWDNMSFLEKAFFIIRHPHGHFGCGGVYKCDSTSTALIENRTCDRCGKQVQIPAVIEVF